MPLPGIGKLPTAVNYPRRKITPGERLPPRKITPQYKLPLISGDNNNNKVCFITMDILELNKNRQTIHKNI